MRVLPTYPMLLGAPGGRLSQGHTGARTVSALLPWTVMPPSDADPDADPDARVAEVLLANKRFYEAFGDLDLAAMSAVWRQDADDVCIHPGWEIMSGWPEVRESWRVIFANTGYMKFSATEQRVAVHGEAAVLTCIENIYTVVAGHTAISRVACTNVFVQHRGQWRLSLHHGSSIATEHSEILDTGSDGPN